MSEEKFNSAPGVDDVTWARDFIGYAVTGQQAPLKTRLKSEPAIKSRNTGQQIACCDSCQ